MWVSKRQIEAAKEYDLFSYLRLADPQELVRVSSNEYCLRSHDSFRISNGFWNWHSRNIGGRSAIDYLMKVKGYDFPDAVIEVNRTMKGQRPSFFIASRPAKKLELPPKNDENINALIYLRYRGIEDNFIRKLMKDGFIYEARFRDRIIFVGLNDSGIPAHAAYRAMDGTDDKGDCYGSDKRFAFRIGNEKSETVRVFESAIDLLSYATICILNGKDFSDELLISTAGISSGKYSDSYKLPHALEHTLQKNPNIKQIVLCLDNDKAGRNAAENIQRKLRDRYEITIAFPPEGKDYNEYLQILKKEGLCNG